MGGWVPGAGVGGKEFRPFGCAQGDILCAQGDILSAQDDILSGQDDRMARRVGWFLDCRARREIGGNCDVVALMN